MNEVQGSVTLRRLKVGTLADKHVDTVVFLE